MSDSIAANRLSLADDNRDVVPESRTYLKGIGVVFGFCLVTLQLCQFTIVIQHVDFSRNSAHHRDDPILTWVMQ